MKSTINFSIIVPCHNSSHFITKLLDTIPNRPDVEVILVDDHSSPVELKSTQALFNRYEYGKKQFYKNEGINSAGAARNLGMSVAEGRWLVFADSDDYFTADISAIMDTYKDADADTVFFSVTGNEVTHRVRHVNNLLQNEDISQLRYRHVVPWGKLVRRKLVEDFKIQFSEVIVSNDELFSAKVGFFAKDIIVETRLAGYYSFERNNSLTTQLHDRSRQDVRMNEIYKKYVFWKEHASREDLSKARLSVLHNVKKAISVGGIGYGIGWYFRLRRVGGRLRIFALVKKRLSR